MSMSEWDKPGSALGLYPERAGEDVSWMDQVASNLGHHIKFPSITTLPQAQKFVRMVHRAGKDLPETSDSDIQTMLMEIRRILRHKGIQAPIAATCFALIRELSGRILGMRHFDVQIIGGWTMLGGMIAEMETGEGKTLTATLPACTAALAGIPVHVITVNDYLVQRDAEWMTPLYEALGLRVGTVVQGMEFETREANYRMDITYCTNKQIAFDYLRDRLAFDGKRSQLQMHVDKLSGSDSKSKPLLLRGLYFAIVDEADSVLIDEARTPLLISKNLEETKPQTIYSQALDVAGQMTVKEDFVIFEKKRTIEFTDQGSARAIEMTREFGGLWKGQHRSQELVMQALNAIHLFIRDKHYIVQDEKVQIIDEFTGRIMADRSWQRDLHQMVEVKEDCPLTGQRETLARVTYQQFFRRYLRVGGMTGTANEVRGELRSVYGLETMKVPTNRISQKKHYPLRVFSDAEEKWNAIVARVEKFHKEKRPVLIGTRSVAVSELLSSLLTEKGLPHSTLNARQDQNEAEIVKQAGHPGRITVATNMAGRGTDIKLAAEVLEFGGLHVIASEPHESRRIDRQLFGRCGRQGDPGSYEMFLSLEDELVEYFAPKWFKMLSRLSRFLWRSRASLVDKMLLHNIQTGAERHNARIRQRLLKTDKQLNRMLAFSGQSE